MFEVRPLGSTNLSSPPPPFWTPCIVILFTHIKPTQVTTVRAHYVLFCSFWSHDFLSKCVIFHTRYLSDISNFCQIL